MEARRGGPKPSSPDATHLPLSALCWGRRPSAVMCSQCSPRPPPTSSWPSMSRAHGPNWFQLHAPGTLDLGFSGHLPNCSVGWSKCHVTLLLGQPSATPAGPLSGQLCFKVHSVPQRPRGSKLQVPTSRRDFLGKMRSQGPLGGSVG